MEKKFTFPETEKFPTINHLKTFCREIYGIKDGEHIEICKYIPWDFEWRHIDPNAQVT
jgi:hypothetical protein